MKKVGINPTTIYVKNLYLKIFLFVAAELTALIKQYFTKKSVIISSLRHRSNFLSQGDAINWINPFTSEITVQRAYKTRLKKIIGE